MWSHLATPEIVIPAFRVIVFVVISTSKLWTTWRPHLTNAWFNMITSMIISLDNWPLVKNTKWYYANHAWIVILSFFKLSFITKWQPHTESMWPLRPPQTSRLILFLATFTSSLMFSIQGGFFFNIWWILYPKLSTLKHLVLMKKVHRICILLLI
jgi:hypothetical protein